MNIPDIGNLVTLKHGKYGKCPFHDDKHNSLSVYEKYGTQRWRCHACDIGGDYIDLVGYISFPDYDKSLKMRKEVMGLEDIDYHNLVVKQREIEDIIIPQYLHTQFIPLAKNAVSYLNKRGIKYPEKYYLGSAIQINNDKVTKGINDNFISIPSFVLGNLIGIKFRNIYEGNRYFSYKGSRSTLFNHDNVYHILEPIILAKGEIAAMVVEEMTGLKTCAPTVGENTRLQNFIFEALILSSNVLVIGDNDKTGKIAASERLESLKLHHINCTLFFPPSKYKDVDEWLLNDNYGVEILRELCQK